MPMLMVRCGKCDARISTGTEMSYDTFRHSTFQSRTIECPNCEHVQTWTQDDVDRTVFSNSGTEP